MKNLILLFLPFSASAGGPAASARNPELLYFELFMLVMILITLKGEQFMKWVIRKVREKTHPLPLNGDGSHPLE